MSEEHHSADTIPTSPHHATHSMNTQATTYDPPIEKNQILQLDSNIEKDTNQDNNHSIQNNPKSDDLMQVDTEKNQDLAKSGEDSVQVDTEKNQDLDKSGEDSMQIDGNDKENEKSSEAAAQEEDEDPEIVVDEWNAEEVEALVDYVAKFGLANWTALASDPILSLRHNGPNHCETKFDELFNVTEEDLEYHFPLIEPPKRKSEKKKKDEEDEDDENEEDGEDEEGSGDEDDDEDRSNKKAPKGKKSHKDDDEFVLDDEHDEDEDEDDDEEEDEDFDDDPLVHEIQELEFDEELDYHPAAYYPDIFKRPRRMGQIRLRPSLQSNLGRGEEKEEEEEYRPRGTRSSARIRDSAKRISYKIDEKDDEFDEVVSRSSGDDEPEPEEKIDRVLAAREITKELAEEERIQQEIVKKLADKEVSEQHPENQVSADTTDPEAPADVAALEKVRETRHNKIENKINMLYANKKKGIIVQYLVKPEKVSYKHCEWLSLEEIKTRFGEPGTAKVLRFEGKRREIEEENEELWGGEPFNPDFLQVEKLISKNLFEFPHLDGLVRKATMYLVKWLGLPYSECTWETAEVIDDQAKIAEFYKVNTMFPDAPLRDAMVEPARLAQWYAQSPSYFKNSNKLRDYQLDGLNWLIQCYHLLRNPILADEMGLGKTVQAISFLYYLYQEERIRGPFLIVVPLSTIQHWKREVEGWTEMNVILYYEPTKGKENRQIIRDNEFYYPGTHKVKFSILLTTYETLIADAEELQHIQFEYVVVDEGHRLKNKQTKLLKCLQKMNIKRRLLLTGTPIQNNTEELWTLLNYVEPDNFFSSEEFLSKFGNLSETSQVEELQKEIRPFVLRRMKENVEKSIPPKEETIIDIELTTLQKQYYRAIYEKNRDFLYKGLDKANLPSLINIEMELRKCCNHPWLIKGAEEQAFPKDVTNDEYFRVTVEASGKLVLLDKLLPKLKSEGHRVLIFSQMKKVLDILEEYVEYRGYEYERLDGSSQGNVRQAAIDRFSKKGSKKFVFLLSTRAGGVGLNLTAADTVIIFDSDWNPQQDVQAQARVHRIGQEKNVMIYRLVTRNTYEAEMFDRASRKLGLEQAVMSTVQKHQENKPSREELDRLLKLGAYGLLESDDSAAKKFTESSIDDILKHGTRVVRHSDESAAGGGGLGSINFSKMTFASAGADASIDINDPDFWNKVLKSNEANKDISLEELSLALVDGSAVKTARSRKDFFSKLKQKVQQVFKKKKAGQEPKDLHDTVSLLKTVTQTAKFLDSEKKTARAWIKDLQRRGNRGADSGDDEEVEPIQAQSDEEEESDADEEEGSEGDEGYEEEVSGDEEVRGSKASKKSNKASSGIRKGGMDNKNVAKGELCGICLKRGKLVECDGPCHKGYHTQCVGIDPETVPSKKDYWECPNCESGSYECLVCGEIGHLEDADGEGDVVVPCSQSSCGTFYHEECIKTCHLASFFKEGHSKFRCPRHYCAICEKSGSVVHCGFCPNAYHPACFPKSAEYARLNPKTMICSTCLSSLKDDAIGKAAIVNSTEGKMDVEPLRTRNEAGKSKRRGKKKKFTPGVYSVRFKMTDTEPQTFDEVPVLVKMTTRHVQFKFEGDVVHDAGDVNYAREHHDPVTGTVAEKSPRKTPGKSGKDMDKFDLDGGEDDEGMDVDHDENGDETEEEVVLPTVSSSRESRRTSRAATAYDEEDEVDGDETEEEDYRPKKRARKE